MREFWAERLLATVMEWPAERIAEERPVMQAMAEYKYNEYQQFSPGMHFVESLALWLKQFDTVEEREVAYRFVKERLVFISSSEMHHLASITYPDVIRPRLIRLVAEELKGNPYRVKKVVNSPLFKQRVRQCLFAGLSDGAQVGVIRRVNRKELTHEQILQSHEISSSRARKLIEKLQDDITPSEGEAAVFRTIIFIDDFTGSGHTCIRYEDERWKGKIPSFFEEVERYSKDGQDLFEKPFLRVFLVHYIASKKARDYLQETLNSYCKTMHNDMHSDVCPVYEIPSSESLSRNPDEHTMTRIQEQYFDMQITDEHIRKGGTDGKFGYADCALPLVLYHNTPNNAISLLWAYDHCSPRGLFPRVSRHLE